jgi:hypothetical protein
MKSATGSVSDATQSTEATDVSLETQDGTTTDGQQSSEGTQSPDEQIDGIDDFGQLEEILNASHDPNLKKPEVQKDDDKGNDDDDTTQGDDTVGGGDDDDDDDSKADGDEAATAEDGKTAKNFRFTKVTDAKRAKFLQILRRNPDMDPHEAATRAGYTAAQAEKAAEQQQQQDGGKAAGKADELPEVLKPHAEAVTTLEAEVADIEQKIKEAEENYKPTGVLNAQLTKATAKLESAKAEKRQAMREHQDAVAWRAQYDTAKGAAETEAVSRYPDVGQQGSVAFALVKEELRQQESKDPKFASNPRFPMLLIEALEKKHPAIFNKAGGKGKIKEVVPGTQPKKEARPLGEQVAPGNRGTQNTLSSQKEVEAAIDELTEEQLWALGDQVGTKTSR